MKRKFEICKLLLQNGADRNRKNRDGQTAYDLIKDNCDDEDLIDLLLGECNAILDACKKGNMKRVKKLLKPENVNCQDTHGRNSSPLHLAAGYNNLDVAEFLLENNANAALQDRGGLIPLHNAASYGHVEMAALILKYNPNIINVTDKWGYSALHEASQKGRTQICALLLAHGADATIKNQDGQSALNLANADDVKVLLESAVESIKPQIQKTSTSPNRISKFSSFASNFKTTRDNEQSTIAGANLTDPNKNTNMSSLTSTSSTLSTNLDILNTLPEFGDGCMDLNSENERLNKNTNSSVEDLNLEEFLKLIELEQFQNVLEKEYITLEILAEMNHKELKELGINAYGHRHKIIKGIEKYFRKCKLLYQTYFELK